MDNTQTNPHVQFVYGDWVGGFELDPDTYSSINPNQDGRVVTAGVAGSSCSTTIASRTSTITTTNNFVADSDLSGGSCHRAYFEFPISIPVGSDVTDVTLGVTVPNASLSPRNCDWKAIQFQPSIITDSELWSDIGNGTTYLSNNSVCALSNDSRNVLDLGTSADADVEANISIGWFAVGSKFTSEVRDSASGHSIALSTEESGNPPELTITYTVPPAPVYVVDLLDVYESSSTTLDSGTSKCLDVDLEFASSCSSTLYAGHTYRFEVEVDNIGTSAGSPTSFEFQDVVATSDVLGSIVSGNITSAGCGTNTNWTPSDDQTLESRRSWY